MKYEQKRVDISTLEGLKKAERMKNNGWRIVQSGLNTVLMERKKGA